MIRQHCMRALSLGLLVAGLGCAHTSNIAFHYSQEGHPTAFQRRERYVAWDFLHHIRRQVYARPAANLGAKLNADQRPIVEQYGKPDWVRRPFRSFHDERVSEWVYLDRAQVFQFVGGELVFQGPLTDYEQILLRHGYPDRAISILEDPATGRQVDVFLYTGLFEASIQQYYLVNGKLEQMQEGD